MAGDFKMAQRIYANDDERREARNARRREARAAKRAERAQEVVEAVRNAAPFSGDTPAYRRRVATLKAKHEAEQAERDRIINDTDTEGFVDALVERGAERVTLTEVENSEALWNVRPYEMGTNTPAWRTPEKLNAAREILDRERDEREQARHDDRVAAAEKRTVHVIAQKTRALQRRAARAAKMAGFRELDDGRRAYSRLTRNARANAIREQNALARFRM